MSGGLLALACYGTQNTVVSGNPQVSWFRKAFVRYTHFSMETIPVPLEGPQQLQLDAPILLKAKIPRSGDLLSDLVLRLDIPDIYSKAYLDLSSETPTLERTPHEFAWIRQLGVRMIDRVTFSIGASKIQEFTGEWLSTRAALDMDPGSYNKWRVMVGDVPELFDPEHGIYADPQGGYPNVVPWLGSTTQASAPSIPGRRLRIPLGLWFSDFLGNALPLVALQGHIAEITIQLRPIRDLYTIRDANGVRMRYGMQRLEYLPTDQYTSVWNPEVFGTLPSQLNNHYGSIDDPLGAPRHFLTDFTTEPPTFDAWSLNPVLESTYVFLTQAEREAFAMKNAQMLVRQVQSFPFHGVIGRNRYDLDVHNMSTRIVWFARRSDNLTARNDYTNLTNWITTTDRPHIVPPTGLPSVPRLGRAGLWIPGVQRRIVRGGSLIINGNNLFQEVDADYFAQYHPYRYLTGNSAAAEDFGQKSSLEMWPIHVYSFATDASSADQPSGTLNTSRANKIQLDIDVEPIPVGARYNYILNVFVETLNFLEISSGLGGLKFAL
jgi:hypothetical protein